MIDTNLTGHAPTWSRNRILQVVARLLRRPRQTGAPLIAPADILTLQIHARHADRATEPVATLALHNGTLEGVYSWADIMADPTITLTGSLDGSSAYVQVTGQLPRGPVVTVADIVRDLPVELPAAANRTVTPTEFAALAAPARIALPGGAA
jgi:hypothetical protein